jgi:hypothetical protein
MITGVALCPAFVKIIGIDFDGASIIGFGNKVSE